MPNIRKNAVIKEKPGLYRRAAASADKTKAGDKDKLKSVAGQLLGTLRKSIKQAAAQENQHERLFGSRDSCISALVTLSELMLKLEEPKPPQAAMPGDEGMLAYETAMTPQDVALVEAFVQRMRRQEFPPDNTAGQL